MKEAGKTEPAEDTSAANQAAPAELEEERAGRSESADGTGRPVVVVVDDEQVCLDLLKTGLEGNDWTIHTYASASRALQQMELHGVDVLLADASMPELDGFQVLRIARQRWPQCKVIVCVGYGQVEEAVRAIKGGAIDFLTKPLNIRSVAQMVRQVLVLQCEPTPGAAPQTPSGNLVDRNSTLAMALAVAPTDCTVLLTGETGVGKEVMADFIQSHSRRKDKPYVKVNCAALSENLIESELFGHEQGAFTGAGKRHTGRFERAQGGTLFLDEIGELSPAMQTKLLRAIQTHEIERVGGTELIHVDFRLICATNQDLLKRTADGKFRQDLFYRVNIMPIHLAPLRQRHHEIPALVQTFLAKAQTMLGRGPLTITADALAVLQSYSWPGNIRELENTVERACLLAREEALQVADFWWLKTGGDAPPSAEPAATAPAALSPLEAAERETLQRVLDQHQWNVAHAAIALNISRSTLYLKLHRYGLTRAGR